MIWRDAYRTREHHTVIVVSHRARSKSSASLRAIARSNARPRRPPRARSIARPRSSFRVSIVAPSRAHRASAPRSRRASSPVAVASARQRAPFSPSSFERDPCRRVRARRAETDRAVASRAVAASRVSRPSSCTHGLITDDPADRPPARRDRRRARASSDTHADRARSSCLPLAPRASS